MSLTEKQLKELLKKIIRKELQERDIEEASVAANVPGYMTPRAFSGTGKMDRRDSVASGSGFTKVNEDKDIGHQDDEPNMLRSTTLELMEYSKKLHDALKKYDDSSEEVDFPNWWQSKLIISKEYLQKKKEENEQKEKEREKLLKEEQQLKLRKMVKLYRLLLMHHLNHRQKLESQKYLKVG